VSRDERQHPRYAHEAALAVRAGDKTLIGRTSNVSRGGLCADLAEALPTGTEVEVDLQLVFDETTQSEPLSVPARVAWCTDVDEGHQIGLSFKPLPAERAELLAMFLRYLDHQSGPVKTKRAEVPIDDRFG
jgi:hypothetical protein